MSDKIEYSRLLIKRATETGVTPTIPTGTTLSTFTNTDLFVGELFLNTTDENLWVRTDNGILQILNSGYTSSIFATGFTYDNANTLTISNNNGSSLSTSINTMTGLTVNGAFSATTLFGDGSGLTNINTGDIYVTGFTYDNANRLTIVSNSGASLNVFINVMTGLTINGAISATTYQNLPIDPDNYVTGGTYNSGTLTLNRQNGSVTVTGFTDTTFSGGSGNCITDLYVSNIIGCSPLSIFSDTSITGFTTGGSYTAKDVNSGGDRLKRTITKSSTGEISESDQQLDRLKFDVDANNGNLYASTQMIDYVEFNTYNDTSKYQGVIKYIDGVGIELSETKVDTGEYYRLTLDKVGNQIISNDNSGTTANFLNTILGNTLTTTDGTDTSIIDNNSTNTEILTDNGVKNSYLNVLADSIQNVTTDTATGDFGQLTIGQTSSQLLMTDGTSGDYSSIDIQPINTIITVDDGTNNTTITSSVSTIQANATDTATGNLGSLSISQTATSLSTLEGVSSNSSAININPNQTLLTSFDNTTSTVVSSINMENISSDGSVIIYGLGQTTNSIQDTLSLDPLNGSYLKSQSTTGVSYTELAFNDTDISIEANDGVDSRIINLVSTGITVTGGVIEYAADYSSQYTDRSIIDKGYVDSVASTGATAGSFGITIDGGGSAITTGVKGYITIPYNGTITGWNIFGDTTGSTVVDVWKDTFANFPPTVADTIAGSEKPTLSSAVKNQDLTLSTWTTSVTAGDIIAFNVDSASTVTRVNLIIYITKS
jgi:hypothetical protein